MIKKSTAQTKDVPIYGVVDERTKAIVYQGDAYTGRFMLFAVLFDVFIRGLKPNIPFIASNWDLMVIVMAGGLISTVYQVKNKVITNRPTSRSYITAVLFLISVAFIAFLATFFFPR
jgi:hypothetical protein